MGAAQGHKVPAFALDPGAMEVLFSYLDCLMKSCQFQHIQESFNNYFNTTVQK